MWGVNGKIRDKTVVCTFWCEVSVYYICKHLYFSCENVDIYENVNIRSMEPVLPVLWKRRGKRCGLESSKHLRGLQNVILNLMKTSLGQWWCYTTN